MASIHIIIITVLALFAPTFAKEFVVGDDQGWKPNFDYQAWATGKEFVVGDTLVFKYAKGNHNVFKVNGTGFEQCTNPPDSEALSTGNDVITLKSPGRKWYICGVGEHCEVGKQKLVITVLSESVSPAPMPAGPTTSSTQGMIASRYYGWMAAAFGILLIVMV